VKQKNQIPFISQDSWNLKLELQDIPSWEVHWSTQVNLSKSLYEHNWIAKWTYFLIILGLKYMRHSIWEWNFFWVIFGSL
jgi:hypothetical protein